MVQEDIAITGRVLHQRISHRTPGRIHRTHHSKTGGKRRDPCGHHMWHSFKLRCLGCCLVGYLALGAGLIVSPGAARADEFTTIAPGDPLYGDLTAITRAGWLDTGPQGPGHSLTRYEMALDTAKAIFTVTARSRADAAWASTVPKPALKSLRSLTARLGPELRKLDVDVNETLTLLDSLAKGAPVAPATGLRTGLGGNVPVPGSHRASSVRPPLNTQVPPGVRTLDNPSGNLPRTQTWETPLSQRLRVGTTVQALAREAADPLHGMSLHAANSGTGGGGSTLTGHRTGAAIGITNWLTFNANYEERTPLPERFSLRDALFSGASDVRSVGGGVDVRVLHGVTLSGNMERIDAPGSSNPHLTRIGGGVGLSGWQNRLSLTANLSRLRPDDSLALTSTAADLKIGVDVTERLSLNLLYQKLFGMQSQAQADSVVAGGLSFHF